MSISYDGLHARVIDNREPEKWVFHKASASGPTEFMPQLSLNPEWVSWSRQQKLRAKITQSFLIHVKKGK